MMANEPEFKLSGMAPERNGYAEAHYVFVLANCIT